MMLPAASGEIDRMEQVSPVARVRAKRAAAARREAPAKREVSERRERPAGCKVELGLLPRLLGCDLAPGKPGIVAQLRLVYRREQDPPRAVQPVVSGAHQIPASLRSTWHPPCGRAGEHCRAAGPLERAQC